MTAVLRFLADESCDFNVVRALRAAGKRPLYFFSLLTTPYWIQVGIQIRHQTYPIILYNLARPTAALMILKTCFRRPTRTTNIQTRIIRAAFRILL